MAIDIFAKIGDIKGDSLDDRHREEIEVLSFSWGVGNAGGSTPGGGGAGKPTFQDLSIVHHIDKATPRLLQACATGRHFDQVLISHRRAGEPQQEFLVVTLEDVLITSVAHGGASGHPAPETVTLAFRKVDFQYTARHPDGTPDVPIHFTYNLKTNTEE